MTLLKMKFSLVKKILLENKKNYDLIAEDFNKKRAFLWPEIEATASYIAPKSLVLDVGCGNGRLFPFITKFGGKYLGFDVSENLIKIAQEKYGEKYFFVGDLVKLYAQPLGSCVYPQPLGSKVLESKVRGRKFDVIYCLAVLHHLPSDNLRSQALENIKSLLKPNGILVLTVWNLWQKKYLKYILKETISKILGKSKLDWKDCYIPYQAQSEKPIRQTQGRRKAKNLIIRRYLHAFHFNELIHLIKASGFEIKEAKKTKWNYLVVAKLI